MSAQAIVITGIAVVMWVFGAVTLAHYGVAWSAYPALLCAVFLLLYAALGAFS